MKNIIKIMVWFLVGCLIWISILTATWAWRATETDWSELDFQDWAKITNNMISARLMGFVKDASWNKIYWKKFDTTQRRMDEAVEFCKSKWMVLPDNMYRDTMHGRNYSWIDFDGNVKAWQSMLNSTVYHYANELSTYSWAGGEKYGFIYKPLFPSTYWPANEHHWTWAPISSSYEVVCVYKN